MPGTVASYFTELGDESWKEAEPSDTTVWFSDVFREYAHMRKPRFSDDANLVLPFLYSRHWEVNQTSLADKPIRVRLDHASGPFGESDTLPRAAMIALIRAKRTH
jgi:hypothetical protein